MKVRQIDAKSAEQRARLDELQRARLRFVEGVGTDAEVQRLESGQPGELPGEDKHADVADLAVPDERRPSRRAPIRRLLGYLIRQWLRLWLKRLDTGVVPGGFGKRGR